MASYIDNIRQNAGISVPQAFVPDWSFLGNTQSQLTDMQRKGFESFRDKYSFILDSDLSREQNLKLREDFKREADATISRISGTDLTDPRNVASAKAIFTPLVENKLYLRDIAVTSRLKSEYAKGQSLMTAADPNTRATYNPYSLKEIQYALEDFSNASAEEALSFQPPQYIQNVDLESLAQTFYDERGWERKEVSIQGSGSRQYIVTDKNGKVIEADVYRYLQSRFANDPLVQANLALKSRIRRREYVDANLEAYGGDKNAATAAYIRERYNALGEESQKAVAEHNNYFASLEYANQEVQGDIERNGPPATAERQSSYQDIMNKYGNAQTEKNSIVSPGKLKLSDNPTSPELLDALAVLDGLEYNQGIASIARSLAYSKAETDIKEDPFARIQFEKDLALRNSIALEQEKARLKMIENAMTAQQNISANAPVELGAGTARQQMGDDTSDAPEYVDYNNQAISEQSALNRQQGAAVIADWARLTGQAVLDQNGNPISDDRIAGLPTDLFNSYIEKARIVTTNGTRMKDDPNAALELSAKLANYDQSAHIMTKLVEAEQNNMLDALNRFTPNDDSQRADVELLKALVKEGYTDFNDLKAEFIRRSDDPSIWSAAASGLTKGALTAGWSPSAWVLGAVGAMADNMWNDPGDRVENILGDRGFSLFDPDTWIDGTWGGDEPVAYHYYNNARDLRGLMQGIDVGVGGLARIGTNLGYASNNGSNVNQFVGIANNAVLGQGATAAFGNITSYMNGEVSSSETAERVLRDMNNVLSIKRTGNMASRNMNVTIYRDPVTNKQYMNIIPDAKTLEEMTGTSKTQGYAWDYRKELQANGITVALEASSQIPESLYSQTASPVSQYMNLNNGAYTLGGSNPLQGGQITVTQNMSGSYDYSGYVHQYNPDQGKFVQVPIAKNDILAWQQSGETIDNIVNALSIELAKQAKANIEFERQ